MRHLWQILCDQVFDPVKWRRLNGWLVVFWIVMFGISIALGLMNNVVYIAILSLYANLATHLGVWAASRAEAKQVEAEEARIKTKRADVTAGEVNVRNAPIE